MSLDRLQHVIVGGGHFVDHAGQLVQQIAVRGPEMLAIIDRGLSLEEFGVARNIMPGQRLTPSLSGRAQQLNSPFRLCADIESSAWQSYSEQQYDRAVDLGREASLMAGSALSGDMQGTVEHGAAAVELYWQTLREDAVNIWEQVGTLMTIPDRDR